MAVKEKRMEKGGYIPIGIGRIPALVPDILPLLAVSATDLAPLIPLVVGPPAVVAAVSTSASSTL